MEIFLCIKKYSFLNNSHSTITNRSFRSVNSKRLYRLLEKKARQDSIMKVRWMETFAAGWLSPSWNTTLLLVNNLPNQQPKKVSFRLAMKRILLEFNSSRLWRNCKHLGRLSIIKHDNNNKMNQFLFTWLNNIRDLSVIQLVITFESTN